MGQFTGWVLDKFIAPKASELGMAEIRDMSKHDAQSGHWIANFFLNSVLRTSWKAPLNAYAYNFNRRAEAAFGEYALAREATLQFVAGKGQSVRSYTRALFHWEIYLGQAWQAYRLLQKGLGVAIYEKGKGTVEERLNTLYNDVKHVESRIADGEMLPEATVPVWITTEGLQSISSALTFEEAADVLVDIAKWATILSDPTEARKRIEAAFP
jgi:hypothetical protein